MIKKKKREERNGSVVSHYRVEITVSVRDFRSGGERSVAKENYSQSNRST